MDRVYKLLFEIYSENNLPQIYTIRIQNREGKHILKFYLKYNTKNFTLWKVWGTWKLGNFRASNEIPLLIGAYKFLDIT